MQIEHMDTHMLVMCFGCEPTVNALARCTALRPVVRLPLSPHGRPNQVHSLPSLPSPPLPSHNSYNLAFMMASGHNTRTQYLMIYLRQLQKQLRVV